MTSRQLKIFTPIISILIIVGVFGIGTYVGYTHRPYADRISGISAKDAPEGITADMEPFWKVWQLINEKYPGAKDVDGKTRVYGAIQGLVSSLDDPYSVYFPPKDAKEFEETINGAFDGIGMEVGIKDKVLTVIAPLKDTPAARAGIKSGDLILKIDDTVTNDMSVDKAVTLIRGKKGTPVRLTIFREGEKSPREISIIRDTIIIPTSETEVKGNAFVIKLYNFGAQANNDMLEAFGKFNASGLKNLVIDLRGNPGGYLDSAVYMASFFLPKGDVIVSEDYGGDTPQDIFRSKGYNYLDLQNIKIVILVDKGSASASEILAGALSEHHVAKLIGETTYGKGSVQEVIDVTGDTAVKITVAKWLTPNGVSISKKGITPDIEVKLPENMKPGQDPVMDRALEFFKTGK